MGYVRYFVYDRENKRSREVSKEVHNELYQEMKRQWQQGVPFTTGQVLVVGSQSSMSLVDFDIMFKDPLEIPFIPVRH